jgi:hypothetical protein
MKSLSVSLDYEYYDANIRDKIFKVDQIIDLTASVGILYYTFEADIFFPASIKIIFLSVSNLSSLRIL